MIDMSGMADKITSLHHWKRQGKATLSTPPPPPPVASTLNFSDASRLINSFLPLRLPTHYETPLSFLAMMNLTAPLP